MSLLFLVIGIGGAAFLAYQGNAAREKVALMVATPTTPMGDLGDGFAEVKGTVSALSESLVSPMTKTECVFYRFHVEERVKNGKNSKWVTRIDDKDYRLCLIEDDSGAVEVDLTSAELHLRPDAHGNSGFMNDASPAVEEALARYGQSSAGFMMNKTMRYTETVLEVGDEVYALGEICLRNDGFAQLTRGPKGIFLVSDQSEDELTSALRTKMQLSFLGAGVTLLVSFGTAVFLAA